MGTLPTSLRGWKDAATGKMVTGASIKYSKVRGGAFEAAMYSILVGGADIQIIKGLIKIRVGTHRVRQGAPPKENRITPRAHYSYREGIFEDG